MTSLPLDDPETEQRRSLRHFRLRRNLLHPGLHPLHLLLRTHTSPDEALQLSRAVASVPPTIRRLAPFPLQPDDLAGLAAERGGHAAVRLPFALTRSMFVFYLPLYGCQTRNVSLRRLLAIGTPLCLTVYGITMSNRNSRFTCAGNRALWRWGRGVSVGRCWCAARAC